MLLRSLTSLLAIGLVALVAQVNAETVIQASQIKSETIPYNFHGEADKTDSYAIPSDSSEEELDEEIEQLKADEKTAHQQPKK